MLKKILNNISKFIDEPHEKIIFATGYIILFGVIHYSISLYDETAYNKKLTFVDALYFSSTSLYTLGFGDFYPITPIGRFFVILQAYLFWILAIIN